jgi:hypothetical protein
MEKKNNTVGCVLIIIIILLVVGFILNYLEEQASRMSGFANFLIGCIIIGVFYLGYKMNK